MPKKFIVLDFDYTIFKLFYNYNLETTKNKLIALINKHDINFNMDNDAFDIFECIFYSNSNEKEFLLNEVEKIIQQAEIEALNSGVEIKGFSNYLKWINKNNLPLIIITNNSKKCVKEFFKTFYPNQDYTIIGRNCERPDLMKPNTYMLNKICQQLNKTNKDICFIGDSVRDYKCAKNFGCQFIGMATKAKKKKLLLQDKKCLIVENYDELLNLFFDIKGEK